MSKSAPSVTINREKDRMDGLKKEKRKKRVQMDRPTFTFLECSPYFLLIFRTQIFKSINVFDIVNFILDILNDLSSCAACVHTYQIFIGGKKSVKKGTQSHIHHVGLAWLEVCRSTVSIFFTHPNVSIACFDALE